jgi:hypothetical protein
MNGFLARRRKKTEGQYARRWVCVRSSPGILLLPLATHVPTIENNREHNEHTDEAQASDGVTVQDTRENEGEDLSDHHDQRKHDWSESLEGEVNHQLLMRTSKSKVLDAK